MRFKTPPVKIARLVVDADAAMDETIEEGPRVDKDPFAVNKQSFLKTVYCFCVSFHAAFDE